MDENVLETLEVSAGYVDLGVVLWAAQEYVNVHEASGCDSPGCAGTVAAIVEAGHAVAACMNLSKDLAFGTPDDFTKPE